VQLRLRTLVMAFFTLCLVLLWLVQPRLSCASFQFSWLGLMPMQVLLSSWCCHRHNCNVVLQCCPAPACCILRAAVLQAATAVAMLCGLLEIINL